MSGFDQGPGDPSGDRKTNQGLWWQISGGGPYDGEYRDADVKEATPEKMPA